MKLIVNLGLILLLLPSGFVWSARVLTDLDGRSIEVDVVSVYAGSATVERVSDGREFSIQLSRLVESDQEYLMAWVPGPMPVLDSPLEAVVIVRTDSGVGSGFFVNQGIRTYLYTNQHVIGDLEGLEVIDSRGDAVVLGGLEVSDSQDLARFRVKRRSGFALQDVIQPEEKAVVMGNSEGAGVITTAEATVQGIGPDEVEVDSDFVPGNSGGPVVNAANEVIGVATYIKRGEDQPEWVKGDTRYAKTRRFAVRPSRVTDWKMISSEDYTKQVRYLEATWEEFKYAYWTYLILTMQDGYVYEIPDKLDRTIQQILRNHNQRQKRSSTRSGREASRRSNLRTLRDYLDAFEGRCRMRGACLTVGYLKQGMGGSVELDNELKWLMEQIDKTPSL